MKENNERIDLIRKVYSKTGYPRIIDTKFNQLGNISVNEQLDDSITVDQFFETYTQLFYDIPSYGSTNSHEYLITTSTEYIGFEADNAIINALQKEITQLRRDLLQSQIEKAEILSGASLGIDVDALEDDSLQGNAYQNLISQVGSTNQPNGGTATTIVSDTPGNPNNPIGN
jgi:hypothetical protein